MSPIAVFRSSIVACMAFTMSTETPSTKVLAGPSAGDKLFASDASSADFIEPSSAAAAASFLC